MNIVIKQDDLTDGQVEALLESHLGEMHKYSPEESIHALDREAMREPSMTYWSARVSDAVAACGALKQLEPNSAELKSMKTSNRFLRQGMAEKLLQAILSEAENRQYQTVYLETGSHEAFIPAVRLYEKYGFVETTPFGDYQPDPYSRFFKKDL